MYRIRFFAHNSGINHAASSIAEHEGGSHGFRRFAAMLIDDPLPVAAVTVLVERRRVQLPDGLEPAKPQELLLEGAVEALRAAASVRFPDERRAALDSEETKLVIEDVAHELAAMAMAQGLPAGLRDLLPVGPVNLAHRLPQRLRRLEPRPVSASRSGPCPRSRPIDRE